MRAIRSLYVKLFPLLILLSMVACSAPELPGGGTGR